MICSKNEGSTHRRKRLSRNTLFILVARARVYSPYFNHTIPTNRFPSHTVVFTVRAPSKGEKILKAHPDIPRSRLSYTLVPDITSPNAFHSAVQSTPPFDSVIHTASPFHYKAENAQRDLIDPAVLGTTSLLTAVAAHAPSVKRVVITSSFAAIYNPHKHPETGIYTEEHWNPVTLDEAMKDPIQGYRASKTFAERAAWEFLEREHPPLFFTIATINPPLILGPLMKGVHSKETINTSNTQLCDLVEGKWKDGLPRTFAPYWVDVRDVALAHVRALEREGAAQKRFIVTAGTMCNAQIATIVREQVPEMGGLRPATFESDLPADLYGADTARSREILGLEYRTLQECVVDSLRVLSDV